ncbi:MAG: hypothetical protein WC107_05285 [Patescibacteria group bacterium]
MTWEDVWKGGLIGIIIIIIIIIMAIFLADVAEHTDYSLLMLFKMIA